MGGLDVALTCRRAILRREGRRDQRVADGGGRLRVDWLDSGDLCRTGNTYRHSIARRTVRLRVVLQVKERRLSEVVVVSGSDEAYAQKFWRRGGCGLMGEVRGS